MIYLLKRSTHNEDFVLDGFAIDEAGLIKLAKSYVANVMYLREDELKVKVDDGRIEVTAFDEGCLFTFYIVKLEQVK